jgi:protein TonB
MADMNKQKGMRWPLFVFLGLSAALHAAVLVVLPGIPSGREVPRFTVLEVVLVQAEPMQSLPARPGQLTPITPPSSSPRQQAKSLAPVLALPEPGSAVANWRPDEARQKLVEPMAEAASVALTPPSFSAAYLRNAPPRYPVAARHAGEQGTVTLRALVSREGLPARVDIEKTSGSRQLDNAALEAVRTWRFAPARQGAEPVESWWVVPIVFRLEGAS